MQMNHLEKANDDSGVDCFKNPSQSLVQMFVDMVQQGRISRGQCPAKRPVFLKPHGVAHGTFKILPDLDDNLKVGLFAGAEYPLWARFSSDTLPTIGDYQTTVGIGLKLFNTPTPKIFGQPDDGTFDFIMQNMDIFFVDTAKDMCEFTKAGVVDGDYGAYFKKHPRTKEILDEMQKSVGSVLASPYWAILPFSFGQGSYVKYMLEPTLTAPAPPEPPTDPTYLAADLAARLRQNEAVFRFKVQFRTNEESMPLDQATVRWPVDQSPFVHIADVVFPVQDVTARNQLEYGERLSWNIWRVTKEHEPQGSIAEVRRDVYLASAQKRRDANGIPDGEPAEPRPVVDLPPCKDTKIVRAAIHPSIGVARVGDSESEYYIGPEVTDAQPSQDPFTYRTESGELKREAARFRIYGYNAAGEVVRELTTSNAEICWTAHLANRKADWFRFITAMDIPETKDLVLIRRNAKLKGDARKTLVIDPGPRSIAGSGENGKSEYRFDTGEFKGTRVYLGELQTDSSGRLLVLGGHGVSASPSGAPPFDPQDPDTFNNADDWYDDIADGPVNAELKIDGESIPVEGAWVLTAPPNYASNVIGWRTLYDLLTDVHVASGLLPVPPKTSFIDDVLPILQRLSSLQWVNQGFLAMFGRGRPMDFNDSAFVGRLAQRPGAGGDPYQALRQELLNAYRRFNPPVNEPRLWPWIYGDDFGGSLFGESPRTMLALPQLQQVHLQRWVDGDFVSDWDPDKEYPQTIDEVALQDQPSMLDKASLHFCLADAFHPGCEVTWPIRHATMFGKPYRIRQRDTSEPADEYGKTLDQEEVLSPTGPLNAQGPGDLTRWMGLPWQGDTAFCRSGYDPEYDPFLPTFWPARVPNWVLTEDDYQIVINDKLPRAERIEAYNRRASWFRFLNTEPTIADQMEKMVAHFGAQGIVEARPGVAGDPDFPEVIYVENLREDQKDAFVAANAMMMKAMETVPVGSRMSRIHQAGWRDEQQLSDAQNLRARKKSESF